MLTNVSVIVMDTLATLGILIVYEAWSTIALRRRWVRTRKLCVQQRALVTGRNLREAFADVFLFLNQIIEICRTCTRSESHPSASMDDAAGATIVV